MSTLSSQSPGDINLNKRYFFAFLAFQVIVLGASLFYSEWVPAVIIGALVAVLFVVGVLDEVIVINRIRDSYRSCYVVACVVVLWLCVCSPQSSYV